MKKAQLQMIETMGVLVVFMFLVAFGFIFYSQVSKAGIERKSDEFSQLAGVQVAQKALFLPELKCPLDAEGCVDKLKLDRAMQVINFNKIFYYNVFKFSRITIQQVYPEPVSGDGEWAIYDNTIPGVGISKTYMPINIYDSINDRYDFGVMIVEYHQYEK